MKRKKYIANKDAIKLISKQYEPMIDLHIRVPIDVAEWLKTKSEKPGYAAKRIVISRFLQEQEEQRKNEHTKKTA